MAQQEEGQAAHDRETFEAQGSAFLKQNLAEKPEFDYAENRPPRSYRLDGKILTLDVKGKPERLPHAFGRTDVDTEVFDEPGPRVVTVPYEAFELAPEVFFVSLLFDPSHSVAMVLDLVRGVATLIRGEMRPDGIVSTVDSARIEEIRPGGEPQYHQPFNLGGTRFLNTYAHNVAYEHIYLTGIYDTWMGVRGPQAGQADTEEYRAFKVDDGIYLLYWNEGVLTAQMTFLFNFLEEKCVAELFARVEGDTVHNTIGAHTHIIHSNLPELTEAVRLDVYTGD